MNSSATLRQLALEPGILFPLANVFAFMQSHDTVAIGLSLLNVALSIAFTLGVKSPLSPMKLTAVMAFLSGLFALLGGSVLAGIAGFIFAAGNYFAAIGMEQTQPNNSKEPIDGHPVINVSVMPAQAGIPFFLEKLLALLTWRTGFSKNTISYKSAFTHPVLYFGLGYSLLGLMAGGGLTMLHDPMATPAATLMVGVGVAAILAASAGMAAGLMTATTPFWILATGTAMNGVAGLVVGNVAGAASCFFSMLGELRLGWLNKNGTHHGL